MAERVARLSEEQWNVVKAALDGEITALRIQVLRAEAQAAPLRAALGEAKRYVKGMGPYREIEATIDAALSSKAGKDWLPPDKVVLARGALALVKKHQMETPGNPLPHWIAQEVWAGLGALKEVE